MNQKISIGSILEQVVDIIKEQTGTPPPVFAAQAYEAAVIGYSNDDRVVYSHSKIIECLMADDGMTEEEAHEWYDFNIARSLPYIENAPIIVFDNFVKEDFHGTLDGNKN